jgi:OPA family glycerol-3-phosphate transporter-like MFS transporter
MTSQVEPTSSAEKTARTPWPVITVAMLTVGYAGYYLCRSDLSVARPLILEQYASIGITKETIGNFTALATALYALGKFIFGSTADVAGGRRMFLLGMAGAIVCTLLFGIGGPPLFLMAWCGNRFIQSSGWVGMVKITSRWFSHSVYGSVMGLISLSFLFGDFLSRLFLSELITLHFTWQLIFYVSAGVLGIIFIVAIPVLREKPADRNYPEPEMNPESLVLDKKEQMGLAQLLLPLFKSPTFWTVCALSFGFTFMRETFNDWTPTYLHEAAKMSSDDAGKASSLFPLFGGFSVLAVGFLSDRVSRAGRALLIVGGLALGTAGLFALSRGALSPTMSVALVAAIGFVLIGPYSLLAGAISLGFGGRQASATAAGWIDGIGYIGGIMSGKLIGEIATRQGWAPAFLLLAITSLISCAVGLVYWAREKKADRFKLRG